MIWPEASARLETVGGVPAIELPHQAPTPIVHERRWWNLLIGNPAGYLAENNPADSIRLDLPSHEYLPWGPNWMRGWLFTYFLVVIAVSLGFKFYWKVL